MRKLQGVQGAGEIGDDVHGVQFQVEIRGVRAKVKKIQGEQQEMQSDNIQGLLVSLKPSKQTTINPEDKANHTTTTTTT